MDHKKNIKNPELEKDREKEKMNQYGKGPGKNESKLKKDQREKFRAGDQWIDLLCLL